MKHLLFTILVVLLTLTTGCKTGTITDNNQLSKDKVRVELTDVPFKTDMYLRVPYTLSLWEYQKEGLTLKKIEVLNQADGSLVSTVEGDNLPPVYQSPVAAVLTYIPDEITRCYLSLQVTLPLTGSYPTKLTHRFHFSDTLNSKTITVDGGEVTPRYGEQPIVIASPVKGKNWGFINQASNFYHFYVIFFMNGKLHTGSRFAFDNLRFDDTFTTFYSGDPKKNESYFNYCDTLFAVANGTVVKLRDGRGENNGDAADAKLNTLDEYAGNYLVLDIGGGKFAYYAHCVPNSFFVKPGDKVKEGDPIGLLGNSGNSSAPHLHFQIGDSDDILTCNGFPFVYKQYTKLGSTDTGPASPVKVFNAGNEATTILSFD